VNRARLCWLSYLVLVYAFLLFPVIVAVGTSVNPGALNLFPPHGFSWRWYAAFAQDADFTHAFAAVSLKIAALVAVISGSLALASAYALVRLPFRGRSAIELFLLSPLMVPGMIVGLALLLFFSRYTVADEGRIVIGHVIITLPIALRAIMASLQGTDLSLEDVARSLGANWLQAFGRVTMPLVGSGLLAAMLFGFTLSFTDVNVALFLTGPRTTTLPIQVFAYLRWQSTPVVAAIAAVQVALVLVMALLIDRLVGLERILRY
jgi:putative spermidine/putrescine transport system permease protein